MHLNIALITKWRINERTNAECHTKTHVRQFWLLSTTPSSMRKLKNVILLVVLKQHDTLANCDPADTVEECIIDFVRMCAANLTRCISRNHMMNSDTHYKSHIHILSSKWMEEEVKIAKIHSNEMNLIDLMSLKAITEIFRRIENSSSMVERVLWKLMQLMLLWYLTFVGSKN